MRLKVTGFRNGKRARAYRIIWQSRQPDNRRGNKDCGVVIGILAHFNVV